MDQSVFNQFQSMIEATMATGEAAAEPIAISAEKIASALLGGNTIFTCASGPGTSIAQLFSDYLAFGYHIDRPAFPVINLNQITAQHTNDDRFSQALNANGKGGDILVLISAGDSAAALIDGFNTAVNRGMTVVVLSGENYDLLTSAVSYNDIHIGNGGLSGPLTTQSQLQVIQCISALVENFIFGGE